MKQEYTPVLLLVSMLLDIVIIVVCATKLLLAALLPSIALLFCLLASLLNLTFGKNNNSDLPDHEE